MTNEPILIYSLWVVCIFTSNLGVSHTESSCKLKINDCSYKLTLLPSQHCDSDTKVRSRRSIGSTEYDVDNIMNEMDLLSSRFKKLEKKLTKEMHQLSTRVLRAARKMQTTANNTHGDRRKKARCPDGFVTYGDWFKCYMLSNFNASWYAARDYCTAMDSSLLELASTKEHFLVTFFIKNNPVFNEAIAWWTSGTYVTKTKQWMWTSGTAMRPISFVKWAVNEPNDVHDKNLQCVMMYALDDHLWHDQICTDKYNFICETPAM